jgi:NADH-quinone oxidoreductase subunit M
MVLDVLLIPLIVTAACALPIGGFARPLAVLAGLLTAGSAAAAVWLDAGAGTWQAFTWAGPLGAQLTLGADGFSSALLMLTGVAFAAGAAVSGGVERPRAYFALWSLLEVAVAGVLVARDLIVFVAFWEALLLPLALLVLLWGGADRQGATRRLVVSWLAADALLVTGVISLGVGTRTFALSDLAGYRLAEGSQVAFALLFLAAFAIRLPLYPLHTWLPRIFAAAPAPVALVLVAVVTKLAVYGVARIAMPLFPRGIADLAPLFLGLAAVGALYAALLATRQHDTRRLIAYASISQLDVIALGVFFATPEGMQGALVASVSHGLVVAALVILVTALARRLGSFDLSRGGLGSHTPVFMSLSVLTVLALIGVPGTGGAPGWILILAAAFARSPGLGLIAVLVGVVAAAYGAGLLRAAFFDPSPDPAADLGWRDRVVVIPLLVLVVALGVAPRVIGDLAGPSAQPRSEVER